MRDLLKHACSGAALALCFSGAALADGCHLSTLSGYYVFSATGYNIVAGVPVPKAIVELIHFGGDGSLTTPAVTVSINGSTFIQSRPGSPGTYTLDVSCVGAVAFGDGPRFDIFMSPQGDSLWMIQTNPNTVLQGNATPIAR